MDKLDQYIDNLTNKTIDLSFLKNNLFYFNYKDINEMLLDLELLLETVYCDYKIIENTKSRINNQQEFRQSLINKYKKCIISDNDCLDELEAAHIIPFSECNNFDINNGLLISANLHKTFDKFHWTIDTNTKRIVVLNNNSNSIKKYDGKYINLDNETIQYFIKRNK